MSADTPGAGAEDAVLVGRVGHTMLVTINRPAVGNAVNLDIHLGVGRALESAESDDAVRSVVVTGAGDRAFCAGADLSAIARGESLLPASDEERAWGFAGFTAHAITKPTIAAINGFALGGGFEIVLAADLAVAADHAVMGLPEVRRGIIAAGGGAFRLGAQIPVKLANELLYTGETITAQRARELDLVNALVPQGEVVSAALDLAERINQSAPLAVRASKRIAARIDCGRAVSDEPDWERSVREFSAIIETEDAMEGPLAFTERRSPRWRAR